MRQRNGFSVAPLNTDDPRMRHVTGRAPRRIGPMGATESNHRLPPPADDRRKARRAQRAARRITRRRS